MDWTVFEIEGVEDVATNAALALANHKDYGTFVEYEDMKQEALLLVASMGEDVREAVSPGASIGLGAIKHRVIMDLTNKVETDARRKQKQESFEHRYTEVFEDAAPRVAVVVRRDGALYTRELVESLLPAVWDESYCYGMKTENAPDSDMPRGSINKATGNTLAAHIVDIKTGWSDTDLLIEERRVLFLTYCLDWTQREIAYNQQCAQSTVSDRLATAIGKIAARLNGIAWHNWEEVPA